MSRPVTVFRLRSKNVLLVMQIGESSEIDTSSSDRKASWKEKSAIRMPEGDIAVATMQKLQS